MNVFSPAVNEKHTIAPGKIFDAMRLKKLSRNRLHAWIEFSDESGKIQEHEYEGTREEIRKSIETDRDLLSDEKCHLLQSLGMSGVNDPTPLDDNSFVI